MNTQEYRLAPSGQGEYADAWRDKPHLFVYDLCSEIEHLQQRLEIAEFNQERYGALFRGEGDYPKLLIHRGKHGDRHILIMDEVEENAAWLAMFQAIAVWDGYRPIDMEGDELEWYERAVRGDARCAKWLLQSRSGHEYEEVHTECIETPYSLQKKLQ